MTAYNNFTFVNCSDILDPPVGAASSWSVGSIVLWFFVAFFGACFSIILYCFIRVVCKEFLERILSGICECACRPCEFCWEGVLNFFGLFPPPDMDRQDVISFRTCLALLAFAFGVVALICRALVINQHELIQQYQDQPAMVCWKGLVDKCNGCGELYPKVIVKYWNSSDVLLTKLTCVDLACPHGTPTDINTLNKDYLDAYQLGIVYNGRMKKDDQDAIFLTTSYSNATYIVQQIFFVLFGVSMFGVLFGCHIYYLSKKCRRDN